MEVSNRNPTKEYTVSVTLRVESTDYTGKVKGLVKRQKFDEVIRPGFLEKLEMMVTYDEYAPELSDQANFNIGCLASVVDTDYEFFTQDDFRVRKPDIRISVTSSCNPCQIHKRFASLQTNQFSCDRRRRM